MAVTAKMYGNALMMMAAGSVNWPTDLIKCALLKPAYAPNQDTHIFRSSITAQEIAASGSYQAGGGTILTPTKAYAARVTTLDGVDCAWTAISGTVAFAAIYKALGGADTADPLLGYVDLGGSQILVGADLSLAWNAAGIFTLTVA